ncbi:hypothetical protein [Vibrio renipiscarius]|uniref:Uncharacterized protein n=1 Tax=Vibrio renipiscarius TaxID=1461322 RepID=A0A0C2K8N7_9VIBR|nr:hypothetical protein [Vibrio renipiscarius]KII77347.1 hypothetical protein PL18_15655 [Vibrio renipiscarius]KII78398.1 hypothetical protein OJ16_10290 [Vibrio renipiscarius]
MLLNDVIQIIEFTDTDHFSEAMDDFNAHGITHSNQLPFLNVVYDKAESALLEKFGKIGFKGNVQLVKTAQGDYIVFDANQFDVEDVLLKFE